MLENNYLYLTYALAFIAASAFGYYYFKNRYDNKVVPYSVGKKTIYLRRKEINHFKSRSREDQRREINRFDAQVKAGKFIPVYKKGVVIGYIPNKNGRK